MNPVSKPPVWLKRFFPDIVWDMPANGKKIYLTFDDGPTPGITPGVLALLHSWQAKATFFCTGNNVAAHPGLINEIVQHGHTVANHGYHHISGFSAGNGKYIENAQKGFEITGSRLFRPPYGRVTPRQIRELKNRDYTIVLWSIMSMDFKKNHTPGQCASIVLKYATPGAIIVFHDSLRASSNVIPALQRVLESLSLRGYTFEKLS